MTMIIEEEGREVPLTPAEKVVVKALPPLIESKFIEFMKGMYEAGLIKPGVKEQMNFDVLIEAFYTAMFAIASMRGLVQADKAKERLDSALLRAIAGTKFRVSSENVGCGDPDCDACSSSSDVDSNDVEVAPSGVTKH